MLPQSERVAGGVEEEYNFSPQELLRALRRRLRVIALTVITLVGAAVGLSLLQTPQYEASIKVLIGQRPESAQQGSLGSDVQGLQQLTQTMAEAVNSRPVAEAVIQRLGLEETPEEFLENLSVEQVPETQFVQVSYRDPDPARAQQVANAVGEEFSEQIADVSPSASSVTATVWERAAVANEPASPNPLRNGFLALVLGGLLGLGLAFLLEYLDDSWQSPEEAERVSGVPTFGVIPRFEVQRGRKGS